MLALAGAALYGALTGGRLGLLAWAAGVLGTALLLGGILVRWPSTIPWAIALVGAGYLVGRVGRDVVDGWAAAVGALLLLAAELAAWSIEHDARIRTEPALVLRRAGTLAALVAVALLVDFLLLGTAALAAPAGVLLAAAGVAAAVSAVAIVLRLVVR